MKKWLNEGSLGLLFIAAAWPIAWMVENDDHQIANLLWIGLTATGLLLGFIWGLRTYLHVWWKRFAVLVVLAFAVFLSGNFVEFRGFSGEMLPQFRWKMAATGSTPVIREGNADMASSPMTTAVFTQFMGNSRNGTVEGSAIQANWDKHPPDIVWRIPVGPGWSGFVVSDGLAITQEQVEDKDAVSAYELSTGKLFWRTFSDRKHYHPLGGAGPRATPTIHGDSVIAQSSTGIVTSMDLRTGKLNWSVDLLAQSGIDQATAEAAVAWGRSGSPLVVGSTVVVPLGAGLTRASADTVAGLIAVDVLTGEEVWRAGNSQISYASPTLMTIGDREQIVIVNESDVTGHDPKSGEVLWKTDWAGQSNGPSSVSQATQLDNQHVLISKGYGGGSKLLKFPASFPTPVQIDAVWHQTSLMKTKFMSPVVLGDYVYGLSDGILECIRWSDGVRMWKDNRHGRLGHGQILLVGNQLLCSSEDGRLVLTNATPEKPSSYESLSLLEGITWNPLALAGDLVLMRNGEQAVCVRVKRD